MNKADQKKYAHLPGIAGGVVTSVREEAGQTIYRYRVPARIHERNRKVAEKRLKPKEDEDDIGQGEGCEGGKCAIRR